MAKHWRIQPHDAARIIALERSAAVPAVVAQLLVCRGIHDAQTARDFLDAKLTSLRDPGELPGANDAADRIMAALGAGRRIVIYGDYDVDGMSGTALLYLCLRMLGADVSYYVPHRIDEGYGLNCDSLAALAQRGAQMLITVDCGASSVAEADRARELGLELVITDHHQLPDPLPAADCIVHPLLPGSVYPFAGLCGAGVAFKLAWVLCQRASHSNKVGERMRNFLMQAIGLVALGTVADVVPLVDENRVLVRHGLKSLRERPGMGIAALMKLTGADQQPALSSEDIAFKLAPRLNAAGRLGQATLGIELLTTDSADRASALAAYLHELNGSRESLERSIYLAANKQATERFDPEGDSALVLADRGWHPGVIGIVASRLAEKFHRPVVLIAFDALGVKPGIGSARSVSGFNLHAALAACSDHLLSHGGHAAAAGLKIEESKLDSFRGQFCEQVACEIAPEARVAELRIDAEVPFSALTSASVADIERMAPFGHSNPRPLLCTSNVTLTEPPKRIGGGERHLSLRLDQHGVQLRAVAFGGGDWASDLAQVGGPIAVAFRPFVNHFRGRKSVELQVCDWQRSAALSKSELCA
jgi:single-stranded-DNA-specific exonuclease